MKIIPLKVVQMTMLFIVFTILFSCSKDTDLLLDSVINDPTVSVEESGSETVEPSAEDGFVVRTLAFSPTNDAYLQNAQGHDRSIVRLQEGYRTSYLMFDLSEINGSITDAVLQFSVDSDEGDGNIDIHKGGSNDWTEKNLTENNAPGLDVKLGSMNKAYKVGAPEKVALSATDIRSELTTLVMTHSTGNDLAFASKEHPTNKGPLLVITYKSPEGSPEIKPEGEEEDPQPKNDTKTQEGGYYVTTSGRASNDGLSEATAWSIEHAFDRAVAGDVVYIKAGDYGSKELVADNSGTADKPIKFIGYTNTPGDLVSNEGSTFKYGDALDASKMPLISSRTEAKGIGVLIGEDFVEVSNFQITRYGIGVNATGKNVTLRNIIAYKIGTQNVDIQDGKSINVYGNNSLVEDCFVYNSTSQGISLGGADNSRVNYCSVYSDNTTNPTGYYILFAGGTSGSVIENCTIWKPAGLSHGGHGYVLKDVATNNIIRNSSAHDTGIEVNFTGVENNTFDNIKIYGSFSSTPSDYSATINVRNGAHHNTFKNIYLEDVRYAVEFTDIDDGFVGSGGDRDAVEGGSYNTFTNIVAKNANTAVLWAPGTNSSMFSNNNEFYDCTFTNTKFLFYTASRNANTKFVNCLFDGSTYYRMTEEVNGFKLNASFQNCKFLNVDFPTP